MTTAALPDRMLTVKECAAMLDVNPKTILALIRTGRLAALDVGTGRLSVYRIAPAAIADLAVISGVGRIARRG